MSSRRTRWQSVRADRRRSRAAGTRPPSAATPARAQPHRGPAADACSTTKPAPPTQDALSRRLSVDRSNAGRAFKRLEQAGYVDRRKDEADSRTNLVDITAKGREAAAEVDAARRRAGPDAFFGELTEAEVASAAALLRKALAERHVPQASARASSARARGRCGESAARTNSSRASARRPSRTAGRRARWAAGGSRAAPARPRAPRRARARLRAKRHRDGDRAVELDDRGAGELAPAPRRARRSASSRSPRRCVRARGTPRSPPATCRAQRPRAPRRGERRQAAPHEQAVPASTVLIGSSTGSPYGPTRARSREAWSSIRATRPWTSASRGISAARTRPRRRASLHSAGRTQSSPAVAA